VEQGEDSGRGTSNKCGVSGEPGGRVMVMSRRMKEGEGEMEEKGEGDAPQWCHDRWHKASVTVKSNKTDSVI